MIEILAFIFLLCVGFWGIMSFIVTVFSSRLILVILTTLAIYTLYDSLIFK